MVPLYDGQQVLTVLQAQLADVGQALLLKGTQNGAPVGGHGGLLQLQRRVQASVAQVGNRPRGDDNCRAHGHSQLVCYEGVYLDTNMASAAAG